MIELSEAFLAKLVNELDDKERTLALALTGSFAREMANSYSDVDVLHFVKTIAEQEPRYSLRYVDNYLISITLATTDEKRAEMQRPETAVWAVQGIRQAKMLLDRADTFEKLHSESKQFVWDAEMQERANLYASRQLMGYAEEVHKILGGLTTRQDSAVLYGTYGLLLGLTEVFLVQHGILLMSENDFFTWAQALLPEDSDLPLLLGFEDIDEEGYDVPPVRMRGAAALSYYIQIVDQLRDIIQPAHAEVIEKTIERIRQSQFINTLL